MQFLKVGELWQDHETQLQVSFIRLFRVICIPKSFFKRWILNMPLRIIIHSNLLKATYLALAWLIENFWLIYYIYQVWKVQTYTNVLIHFSPPCKFAYSGDEGVPFSFTPCHHPHIGGVKLCIFSSPSIDTRVKVSSC